MTDLIDQFRYYRLLAELEGGTTALAATDVHTAHRGGDGEPASHRSWRIDVDAITARLRGTISAGDQQPFYKVMTRKDFRWDVAFTVCEPADGGRVAAMHDPAGGAKYWDQVVLYRTDFSYSPLKVCQERLRAAGWSFIDGPSFRAVAPSVPELQAFATATACAEVLLAVLADRPKAEVRKVAGREARAARGGGLDRLGWGWTTAWAAETLGLDAAIPWRKGLEHDMRHRFPTVAGGYYQRVPLEAAHHAMADAGAAALASRGAALSPEQIADHVQELTARADPAAVQAALRDFRRAFTSAARGRSATALDLTGVLGIRPGPEVIDTALPARSKAPTRSTNATRTHRQGRRR